MDSNVKAAIIGVIGTLLGTLLGVISTFWIYRDQLYRSENRYQEQLERNEEISKLNLSIEALKLIEKRRFLTDSLLFGYRCTDINDLFIDRYNLYVEEAVSPWNSSYITNYVLVANNFNSKEQSELKNLLLKIYYNFESLHRYLAEVRYSSQQETLGCRNSKDAEIVWNKYEELETNINQYISKISPTLDVEKYILQPRKTSECKDFTTWHKFVNYKIQDCREQMGKK